MFLWKVKKEDGDIIDAVLGLIGKCKSERKRADITLCTFGILISFPTLKQMERN